MKQITLRIIAISALAIVLVLSWFGFRGGKIESVIAEEKSESVVIIPAEIESEGWQNSELSKTQDLSEGAIFNDFNSKNSASVLSTSYQDINFSPSSSVSNSNESAPPRILEEQVFISPEITPELTPEPTPEPTLEFIPEVAPDAISEPTLEIQPESIMTPDAPSESSILYDLLIKKLFSVARAQEVEMATVSYERFKSCEEKDSECVTKNLEFYGFGIADTLIEKPVKNVQLRLSLAAAKGNIEDPEVPGRIRIEYFFKNKWSTAGDILVTDEVSNALNGGYFLYALPEVKSWGELDGLRVRLSVQYFGELTMNVFLDGLWLEADADFNDAPELVNPVLIEEDSSPEFDFDLISSSQSFDSNEIPIFSFDYQKDNGMWNVFSYFLKSFIGKGGVSISVTDQKTYVSPKIDADGEIFKIEFDNSRFYVPGRHRLKMNISDNGSEYQQEQEFLWGTLFANLEKSSYRQGETAKIYIEVLDDLGVQVCNSKIKAVVKSSLGRVSTFSTDNNNIYYSGKCLAGGDNTSAGFYFNYQIPPEVGTYTIEFNAETSNGFRTFTDNFEVKDLADVQIERTTPVNIVPGKEYDVSFTIKSEKDFEGIFKEVVPANFEIIPLFDQNRPVPGITEDGYSRVISWPVSMKAGDQIVLSYSFRALNSASALYVIGPASLDNIAELKPWQIIASGGDRSLVRNENSSHFCKIEPFSQKVLAGSGVSYQVTLISSEADKPFLLLLPDMPSEVAVSLNRATGIGDDIVLNVMAQPDASKGSRNLVLVYQERESNGAILSTFCQFNLVVE